MLLSVPSINVFPFYNKDRYCCASGIGFLDEPQFPKATKTLDEDFLGITLHASWKPIKIR